MKPTNRKLAAIGFTLLSFIVVVIEILIIAKILPYDIIGGGRLESYDAAMATALFSIAILTLFSIIVLREAKPSKDNCRKISLVFLWIIFGVLSLNIIANCLGETWFEKIVMTLIGVLQIGFILTIIKSRKTLRQ
ncbi:MAG: hypothetical protein LBS03_11495 [Bacteroidales bacterium]|jgi:hypothetical protein|nr:hypothetical protein [Bacteroidales bacterium]